MCASGGLVLMVLGVLALAASGSFQVALASRGLWQTGLRFMLPAVTAALVLAAPAERRSTVLGVNVAISMVFTIVAQNLGAQVGESAGWQAAMTWFAGVIALAAVVFLLGSRPTDTAVQPERPGAPAGMPGGRSAFRMPSMWLLCLLVICACEEGLVDTLAVVQMREQWNTGAVAFARIISLGMMLAIFVNLAGGWLGDRLGHWNLLIASGVLNTLVGVCLLAGQGGSVPIYVTGLLIAKALQLSTALFVNAMAPRLLGGREVGPIVAIVALGGGVGQYVGPQVLGVLRDVTGAYTAGWVFITLSGALATALAFGFKRYYGRPEVATAG
ncbi:MAG: MFS transporter [Gammaproteobacteria bacterium]|nr:MFS transporter [Gammaproteobacteria bacterium]